MRDPETRFSRQQRLGWLAKAPMRSLSQRWLSLGLDPEFTPVRGPESGLVVLRGRIGGTGAPFNFGEATATRATVKLANGAIGHSMVIGRDTNKARLVAVIDALAQDEELAERLDREITTPMVLEMQAQDEKLKKETAATKVDFFTMVRGED